MVRDRREQRKGPFVIASAHGISAGCRAGNGLAQRRRRRDAGSRPHARRPAGPDALIVAAAMGADAVALATFDRGQTRYGFPVVMPSGAEGR
jgi:hypothetical protein